MSPTNSPTSFELNAILDAAGTMIVATDLAGTVRIFNPAAESLLGWSAAEVIDRQTPAIWHDAEEIAARAAELSQELGRTVSPGFEVFVAKVCGQLNERRQWTYVHKNGGRFPVQLIISAIRDATGVITGYLGTTQDLSDRVQIEDALRKSERHLKLAVEVGEFGIWDVDLRTGNAKWSDYVFLQLGYPPATHGEAKFEMWKSLVLPSDLPEVMTEFERAMQTGSNFESEHRLLRADNRQMRWNHVSARFFFDESGQAIRVVGISRDITARKRAEKQLFQRGAELSESQRLARIGSWYWDAESDGDLNQSSAELIRIFGLDPTEPLPKFSDQKGRLYTTESWERLNAAAQESTRTGIGYELDLEARRADGTTIWITTRSEVVCDDEGRIVGLRGTVQDITDYKKLYSAVQKAQQFNQSVLDALSAHVAVIDETGKIVATNRAWRGFAEANNTSWQSVGEGTNYLAVCDTAAVAGDADAGAAANAIRRVLAGEQQIWMHEYPCHSIDEQRWFFCRVTRFSLGGPVYAVVTHENITTMKQAQEELTVARMRFETLSPVSIMFFDSTGECTDVNDRWCETSGITRLAARGDGWCLAVHPDDRARVSREWKEAIQHGGNFRSEWRSLRPDGNILWLVGQGIPIRDANGAISGFIRVCTDVTEQKQTEQLLRLLSTEFIRLRGTAFYEAAVRKLAESVKCEIAFISSPDPLQPDRLFTRALFVDGEMQPNIHYPFTGTPCEQVRNGHRCVIGSGAREKYPQGVFLADHQIEAFVGIPFIDSHGRQLGSIGVISRQPLTNPENVASIVTLFSVSVGAKMEGQASEQRFSDLFEFSPDAVVITDLDGIIVQANRQVATIFGWTPEDLVGQAVEVLMPPDLRAGHPSLRQRYLQTALPRTMRSGPNDLLGIRKDGTPFPVDISLSPMHTPQGMLVAAAVRDVTERQAILNDLHSAAENLRAANAVIERERGELAVRVAERTADLTAANEELIRASQFKSEFLATMSHELRTPLNGVLGMNELLLKTPLTDRQREFVNACSTSGRALLSLINDVLDISKIEAGKIELDFNSCDLEALAYDVISMFSHRATQSGVSLSCRLDPETCVTAMCDDTRMRQILVNLIGNALKFTSAGGVVLESKRIQQCDRRIVIQFAVTDTGLGIPEDKLDRLFSKFSQVDRSTARHFGGTGLGLSIAKQLTELMGGTIGVTSRLGVGSSFWIEVPFELVNAGVKTKQRAKLLSGTKVLAVDGLDKERGQIADCLNSWECHFDHVSTLLEAVDAVSKAEADGHPYSVVLADCRLAIGHEFIHLQNLARRPNLPVIGLGLSESNEMASHLSQLGLRHLLHDPVRPSTLFNALASLLAVPFPTAPQNPKPDVAVDEQATTFSASILVAEDHLINQMFIRELLKHFGCTCDIVNNGDEALTALEQKRYDLVLMDCQMPEMDGFTASREIRRRETVGDFTGHLPIIALTANTLKDDRERCLEAGMDDYLSKPFQAAKLQAILGKYLSRTASPRTPPAEGS